MKKAITRFGIEIEVGKRYEFTRHMRKGDEVFRATVKNIETREFGLYVGITNLKDASWGYIRIETVAGEWGITNIKSVSEAE